MLQSVLLGLAAIVGTVVAAPSGTSPSPIAGPVSTIGKRDPNVDFNKFTSLGRGPLTSPTLQDDLLLTFTWGPHYNPEQAMLTATLLRKDMPDDGSTFEYVLKDPDNLREMKSKLSDQEVRITAWLPTTYHPIHLPSYRADVGDLLSTKFPMKTGPFYSFRPHDLMWTEYENGQQITLWRGQAQVAKADDSFEDLEGEGILP